MSRGRLDDPQTPSSSQMLVCMGTKRDIRVVEVYGSVIGVKLRLTFRSWWQRHGDPKRLADETRMVIATLPVPPTDDDLIKYVQAMARFCVNPQKRAFNPPPALVWREVGFGNDVTHEHGEARDGRAFIHDPLPLNDGSTDPDGGGTILPGAKPGDAAAAKRLPSSAREPTLRALGKGRTRSLPGG